MNSQKKEWFRGKIASLVRHLRSTEDESLAVDIFMDLMEDVETDIEDLKEGKVSSHDIALLIQEMRAGFAQMEKRFEAVDKRFEDLIHYIDKRFEAVDKRFEDMNRRFTSLQWFMGIGFTMLALLITVLTQLAK